MPDLTETDYDALFAVMQADIPYMWRDIFPKILAQLEGIGALTIAVTDTEVVVSSAKPPQIAVYRVERPWRLPLTADAGAGAASRFERQLSQK
jgi:hypothetical protein